MPIAPLTPNPAGVMDWADFEANLDDIRDYINAIPGADVDGQGVPREAIVRPSIIGFPVDGYESSFQSFYFQQYGPTSAHTSTEDWGPLPERITIVPDATDMEADRKWITPIGRTIYAVDSGDIEVFLSFLMQVIPDPYIGSPAVYPTAGGGETGGRLELVAVNRTTGAISVQTESRRTLYSYLLSGDPVVIVATIPIDAGVWDVYLQYVRDNFDDDRWEQIDLANIEMTLEVL